MNEAVEDTELAEDLARDSIDVEISPDGMSAYLVFNPRGGGMEWSDASGEEQCLVALEKAGVTWGIDLEAVRRALERARWSTDGVGAPESVLVAQGNPPTPGEDAWVDYHPSLTEAGGRPRILPDGTVDLLDLNLVRNVARGTVLAVETPPTEGRPGTTVQGDVVPARAGRDLWLRAGKGVILSEDKLTAMAEVDGHATIVNGKVTVTSVFEVQGNVGVETGNLEFVGTVVIKGDVQRGIRVKAEGDVEVLGSIDGGIVEAGGSVTVRYGIVGGGHGMVTAGGAVRARFIENGRVSAGTSVWAADGILQSHVEAASGIEVLGRRGAIRGGRVVAGESVAARHLGTPMGTPTEIVIGVVPGLREKLKENRKRQGELEESLRRADQAAQFLAEQGRRGQPSSERRDAAIKVAKAQEQLYDELEATRASFEELQCALDDVKGAWAEAREVCHPGVRIVLGSRQYPVVQTLQRTRFKMSEAHEIEATPL